MGLWPCVILGKVMSTPNLENIEAQLDELIQRYQQLQMDYQAICRQRDQWDTERARLLEKNALACARIETMLQRLKSIELEASQ